MSRVALPPGKANARSLFSDYRIRSRRAGFVFALTFEEFLEITTRPCYLCGALPAQIKRGGGRKGDYVYNGIDRVDNDEGYKHGNVEACCKTCNFLKGQLSLAEFKNAVRLILKNLGDL